MRTAAATVATALLATSVLMGSPPVSAAPAGDAIVPAATCSSLDSPACEVVGQVLTLLGPLQPVLEVAGPALGDLGQAANLLTALLERGPDRPPAEVASAAGAVLHELSALSAPLLELLRDAGVGVDPLESALAELQRLAGDQLAPTPAPASEPESAGPTSDGTASSSGASGPTGFGGALSAAGASSSGGASGPSIPIVQVGGTLELGPLALPSLSFTTRPAASAHELAREAAVAELVGPAVAAALAPEDPDSSRATAVVMALCMLMLAAGLLLDQRRKARIPIRV